MVGVADSGPDPPIIHGAARKSHVPVQRFRIGGSAYTQYTRTLSLRRIPVRGPWMLTRAVRVHWNLVEELLAARVEETHVPGSSGVQGSSTVWECDADDVAT